MWSNKKVVVAVTGGIAAYKTCSLVSKLRQEGAEVKVAMTKNATSFISPECFEALARTKVYVDLWGSSEEIPHISLGQECDLIVVAPATANILAKMACGIADDLVSTMLMAATAPIVVVPSMNSVMWDNPAVQANLKILATRGVRVVNPDVGNLACGTSGKGRFPELDRILAEMAKALTVQSYQGKRVLITAGPTREYLDPVRFLSNPSTGKMGLEIAKAAWQRGAEVTLILGQCAAKVPDYIQLIPVVSAQDMLNAVLAHLPTVDVLFKTAAVADYRPKLEAAEKIKKTQSDMTTLELERNPDILLEVKAVRRPEQIIVGFAAETEADLIKQAKRKLVAKGLDFIVANSVYKTNKGFGSSVQSEVVVLGKDGSSHHFKEVSKEEIAHYLCDLVFTVNQ